MSRVVLYLRVSSPEQHTHMQKQICEKYINEKQYKIIKIIEEKCSGYKNTNKRQLFTFLQNLDNEEQFDKLIIYSFDRFSRNIIDGIEMVQMLEDRNIIVESVIDNINYTTPYGRKMLAEKFIMAQYESDLISFRVKESNKFKRSFGLHIGCAPFGKRIEPVHKKDLIDDKEEQKIINFIEKAKSGGLTSEELTKMINEIKELETDDIIGTFDEKNKLIEPAKPMTHNEISTILNDCNIKKRKRSWTPRGVSRVIKMQRI